MPPFETQKYLEIVRKRGEEQAELKEVYQNIIRRKELFLMAYAKLYANKGALTPGVNPEDTIDGMSMKRIESIMDTLKKRAYQWTPVRRTYIEKRDSKKLRPLGMPGWSDKLLEEVIRLVLSAYYEPQFRESSHGFRPQRGCHTALKEKQKVYIRRWQKNCWRDSRKDWKETMNSNMWLKTSQATKEHQYPR